MYAIIRTGGKQYRVQPGDVIRVEKLSQDLGSEFDLTDVLMVGGENSVVGQPTVPNAKVTVVITKQAKDRKVIIFKKKRRQGYRRLKGHRQPFTEIFVKSISLNGKVAKTDQEAKVVDVQKERDEKIQARTQAKIERNSPEARKQKGLGSLEKVAAKKKTTKKVAKKAGKKSPAKKKGQAKKGAAKKVSKKAAK